MSKTNLIKMILIMMVAIVGITLLSTEINAASDGWDLIENNTTEENATNTENENSTENSTNSASNNTSTNNTSNNTSKYNNTVNTSNSSKYNNSANLPDTGLEDSFPTVALIIVFGVSAIFAYKKIKEYNNI